MEIVGRKGNYPPEKENSPREGENAELRNYKSHKIARNNVAHITELVGGLLLGKSKSPGKRCRSGRLGNVGVPLEKKKI